MEYKGFHISKSDDENILSKIYDYDDYIKGAYFQVYADEKLEIKVGSFDGVFGIDMRKNAESIDEFVKYQVDKHLKEYKKRKFYAYIDKEYNEFLSGVCLSGDVSDVVKLAEKISKMELLHEYISIHKPFSDSSIEYFLGIVKPLETICNTFRFSLMRYGKTIEDTIYRIEEEKIGESNSNDKK